MYETRDSLLPLYHGAPLWVHGLKGGTSLRDTVESDPSLCIPAVGDLLYH